jgi:hypothetical protein
VTAGLLQSSMEVTKDIDQEVGKFGAGADGRMIFGCYGCGRRNMSCSLFLVCLYCLGMD